MTSLTIELDDAVYERLLKQAKARDVGVSDLIAEAASLYAGGDASEAKVSPEVAAIIARQIEYYRPVFRRLAE